MEGESDVERLSKSSYELACEVVSNNQLCNNLVVVCFCESESSK